MLTCDFLESIDKEISKRLYALENPETETFSESLWEKGIKSLSPNTQTYLNKILSFASSIQYHHVGLSSKAYCAHPIRVAGMTLILSHESEKQLLGSVALLHNVLEVSSINVEELRLRTDNITTEYIQKLTVTRDLQEDPAYLNQYYNSIASTSHKLSIVKIIDKLDNLFMLGLNPDSNVKASYLTEIENYVLPLVEDSLPILTEYMKSLVSYNRKNEIIDKSKFL